VQSARGATDEALALCTQAAAEDPHEASIYLLSGRLHESKKDWKSAGDKIITAHKLGQTTGWQHNLAYLMIQSAEI
jgi:hypothetical protein